MQFNSKFGLGEIVLYKTTKNGMDEIFRVVAVSFSEDQVGYVCRRHDGVLINFLESELEGDPDFDQVLGRYPPDA